MIWLEDRIDSWRKATTVNGVNKLKNVMPYLLEGNFLIAQI